MALQPRGELILVEGRRFHVVRVGPRGAGPPVLLEAGSFGFSADWAVVQHQLAEQGVRSIAYDRAGMGLSDRGPSPRDGLAIVSDLEGLLAGLDEAGPFVATGHSMAGLHIHHFAARNPDKVAGLVFVDAVTPELAAQPWVRSGAAQYVRLARGVAWLAHRGLLNPLRRWGDRIGLMSEVSAYKHWAFADAAHNRAAAEEVVAWEADVSQAAAAGALDPAWPVAVVLAGAASGTPQREALRTAPADRSAYGHVERVVAANHASLLGRSHAQAVVRAIVHVRTAAMEHAA
jgi:pimeloyl-ACP methyl ester carboxylesterase